MHRLDRVLLTNDDGIDAPGLAVLEQVAAELARGPSTFSTLGTLRPLVPSGASEA